MVRAAPLLLLLLALPARATTMLALDLPGLTGAADAVVQGTVKKVSSRWTPAGGRIVTEVELQVAEAWKGGPRATVTVLQPGGVVGELAQRVDGAATFVPGEEVVLFLEARGDRFTVAGLAQGRFKVERGAGGASARQDQVGALRLLDPRTREEVAPAPLALQVGALKQRVAELVKASPGTAR